MISAGEDADRDDALADAARFGVSLDPRLLDRDHHEGVWQVHCAAVMAFLRVATQWNALALADGRTRVLGLDYGRATAGLANAGVKISPELWSDLQLIEAGALAEMNRGRR